MAYESAFYKDKESVWWTNGWWSVLNLGMATVFGARAFWAGQWWLFIVVALFAEINLHRLLTKSWHNSYRPR